MTKEQMEMKKGNQYRSGRGYRHSREENKFTKTRTINIRTGKGNQKILRRSPHVEDANLYMKMNRYSAVLRVYRTNGN